MHPLLRLLATQPQLLAEHAQAYGELVALEIGDVSAAWRRRTLLKAAALCCLGVAAALAGVALMLWSLTAAVSVPALWTLISTPLLPLVAGLWCLMAARVRGQGNAFDNVRRQISEDLALLREAGAA